MKNIIFYGGRTFTPKEIQSVQIYRAVNLLSRNLEADTLTAVVKTGDGTIRDFKKNTPLNYYRREKLYSIDYLESVKRDGPETYRLYGMSAVGRLIDRKHPGGIYTGQTAEEVILDICGEIPVIVKELYRDIRLYGWLPYANGKERSARDNLLDVLFAIGADLETDLNGTLRVQPVWAGMSAVVPRDKLYRGAEAETGSTVTEVSVTEHQYVPGREETVLFEGSAESEDIITFGEPMHSLSADGFSILASGANWARLSAGTGKLVGKKYVHTTMEIREPVTPAEAEKIESESRCTLISLINSRAAAERLANYYKCRETIRCAIVTHAERPGDVVGIYHPYEKKIMPACISSMDTTVSSILKSEIKALVGYDPPQYEQTVGYDQRILLTGKGSFKVPESGVTHLRGALIEEGSGGWSGLPGEAAEEQRTVSAPEGVNEQRQTKYYADGGNGGKAGVGGSGGKIYQFEMDVEPGQEIFYSCGPGGPGGAYSPEESKPGTAGTTATVFGRYSSASGSVLEAGFLDPVTNTVFGGPGEAGVDGGKGCGSGGASESVTPVAGGPVVWQGKTYYPGNATQTIHTSEYFYNKQQFVATATEGLGGGAAAGSNGQNGGEDWEAKAGRYAITAKGGAGGDGADAAAPTAETRYGYGGAGGNGGGGAGSPGIAEAVNIYSEGTPSTNPDMIVKQPSAGTPGKGTPGGRGGPGCVILYYTDYRSTPGGALMTGNGRFFLDGLGRLFVI